MQYHRTWFSAEPVARVYLIYLFHLSIYFFLHHYRHLARVTSTTWGPGLRYVRYVRYALYARTFPPISVSFALLVGDSSRDAHGSHFGLSSAPCRRGPDMKWYFDDGSHVYLEACSRCGTVLHRSSWRGRRRDSTGHKADTWCTWTLARRGEWYYDEFCWWDGDDRWVIICDRCGGPAKSSWRHQRWDGMANCRPIQG